MYCTKQEVLKIAKAYCRERGCTIKKADDRFAACNKKTKERVSAYLTTQMVQDLVCNNELKYLVQA